MAFPKIPYTDYYVYVLFRETGHPFYIGLGRGARWEYHEKYSANERGHKSSTVRVVLAARMDIPKVKVAEGLSLSKACKIERAFIAAIGRCCYGGPLTNATDGGEGAGGHIMSDEVRKKQSERMKGKPNLVLLGVPRSQEIKDKISKALSGKKRGPYSADHIAKAAAGQRGKKRRPHSEEHKKRIRAIIAAQWSTPEGRKLREGRNIGYRHTPEAVKKMRESALARIDNAMKERFRKVIEGNVGRKASQETRIKMSASQSGRVVSEETKAKMRASYKLRVVR